MCLGNDKMKPKANVTWRHKYSFVCISLLGNILHPKMFQGLHVDTHQGRHRWAARALLGSMRMSPESWETQRKCSLYQGATEDDNSKVGFQRLLNNLSTAFRNRAQEHINEVSNCFPLLKGSPHIT